MLCALWSSLEVGKRSTRRATAAPPLAAQNTIVLLTQQNTFFFFLYIQPFFNKLPAVHDASHER